GLRAGGLSSSRHRESRPWSGELLRDLRLRRVGGHRRTGPSVLLAFARSDQPKEELARGLLVFGRKRLKGPLRRDPNRLSHPARARIGIGGHCASLAARPRPLEGLLDERQRNF